MRDYGIVSPRFWIGETGRKLRKLPDAQRIAMYLLTAPMAEMTGVFYCPVATILNDVGAPCEPLESPLKGLERGYEGASDPLARGFQGASKGYEPPLEGHQRALEGVKRALLALQALGFCYYDFESEYVFVIEMARWQIAPKLKASDNRAKGLRKIVENLPNPMRARFIARYNEDFSLGFDEKEVEKMLSESKPLASPFEAPWEALRSQEQDQEQEQDISSRVSTETLSSANANASESEPAEENQTNLFDSIKAPRHNLAEKSDEHPAETSVSARGVAAATADRTPAPKNGQTESKPLSGLENHPAPKVAPNPADAHPEIASETPQIGESDPADALAPKSAKRNPPVPYQKVVDLYNAKCTPALAAARLTDKRKDDIRKRWHEMQEYTGAKTEEETLAEFGKYFDRISRSDFLKGLKTDFKADFPWLMQRGKIELVFEGRYDSREHAAIARNSAGVASPLPAHLNPCQRFDAAFYADAKKPDGTTDWGI
jgi:hypothetical protein|nr:MAG TPA: hypothetical protein [Caudoviricetes sp.]